GDNLCSIEKENGKNLKPSICTLFPFNRFTRIGRTIAVSPHYLCPLRLEVPAQPGQVEGTHSKLEAALRESALLEPAYIQARVPAIRMRSPGEAEAALAREERFRNVCSSALGVVRFSD